MSMVSLFCHVFAQKELLVVHWITARISGIEETSLHTHSLQRVYVVRKKGRTGVGPVPRTGFLSPVLVAPRFLQTTLRYTPDLGHLAG